MVQLVDVLVTVGASLFFFLMGLAVKYLHDMTVAVKSMESSLGTKMDTINSSIERIGNQMRDVKETMIRLDTRLTTPDGGVRQSRRENQDTNEARGHRQRLSEQNQRDLFEFSDTESKSYATSSKVIQLENSGINLRVKRIQRPHSTIVEFRRPDEHDHTLFPINSSDLVDELSTSGHSHFDQPVDVVVKSHKANIIIPSTDPDLVRAWIEEAEDIIDELQNKLNGNPWE